MKIRYYPKVSFIVLIGLLMLSAVTVCRAEEITLTTYYPSPYGVYSELRLYPKGSSPTPCQPGTMYYDNDVGDEGLKVCGSSQNWQLIGGGYWVPGDVVGDIRNINLSGDVGIGISNPQARLDVSGIVRTDNFMDAASFRDVSNTAYYLDPSNAVTSLLTLGSAGIGVAPASKLSVNGGISAGTYASTAAPANGMIISGNVGIGTAGPGYKLDVLGDILAQGWLRTVGATGWVSNTYGGGWFMQDASWIRAYGNKGVYTTGEVQAGTVRGNSFLCIGGDCRNVWPSGGSGNITINGVTSSTFTFNGAGVSQSGSTFTFTGGGGGIGGSGTTGYVPKFNGATSLTNSQIYDNGANVGIGTTVPGSKLTVGPGNVELQNGIIMVKTAYTAGQLELYGRDIRTTSNQDLYLNWANTGGNIVIGGEGENKILYMAGGSGATGSGSYIDTGDYYIRSKGRWASQGVGPSAGQRFTVFNGGGGVWNNQALGAWSFCMLVEHQAHESGGSEVHTQCIIDGTLNGSWTLRTYAGSNEDTQCSAFCVKW